jgi:ATP-binding cassette, subfamily G (WHITE), member 2, SNQ2
LLTALVTDFGIFLAFCMSNVMLVYFFVYTVRVKGWTFGFGPLGRGIGKVFGVVKRAVVGRG